MARINRRRDDHLPLRSAAAARVEVAADGEWQVRQVSGSAAIRTYRCPGCDQVIETGTPHVVAWPADEVEDLADDRDNVERRHWHTGCWRRERGRSG